MPELPEVETIVRQLAPALRGRAMENVRVLRSDILRESPHRFTAKLVGSTILAVRRRGKNVVMDLDPAQLLLVNLGMTGRLLLSDSGKNASPPDHLAVEFFLSSGGYLRYDDVRRFGHLLRFSPEKWKAESGRLGPEPLDPTLTPDLFYRALSTSRSPVRSWLLDQSRLAGVGNIYANEALFRGGIHPARKACDLDPGESEALLVGLRSVLRDAIEAGGTTLRDYRTTTGESGGFAPSLQVYGRAGDPCPACNGPIRRIVFANRSAFLCPRCQPEVESSVS